MVVILLFIATAIGVGVYLQKSKSGHEPQSFITSAVKRGNLTYSINASGMVYPSKTVKVGAQVSGEISKLAVSVGDVLKKGDLIAEIDASTQENAKSSAQAKVDSQQATLKTAKSDLLKARSAFKRAKMLLNSGAGSQADYESARSALSSAQNAVTQAQANIVQSQLTLSDAEVALGYTQVNAPIDGTVIAVSVEEGQTVSAAQSAPTLVTLAQTDKMTVKAEIAEADVATVSAGLPVHFTLLGKKTKTYTSTLKSIDPAPKEITEGNSLTSSTAIYYYGDIDIDNPTGELRYGMTATVTIEVDKAENALIIPMTAINDTPRGSMVMVLENDRPTPHPITLGLDDGINAQVLSGLNEGDAVIVSNGDGSNPEMGRRGPPGGMF